MRLHHAPFLAATVIAGLLVLPVARSVEAQGVHPSLLVGFGAGSWSGPYAKADESASAVAVAVDWNVKPQVTLRAELGLATRGADMGPVGGFFDETGTLLFTQKYLGVLARVPLSSLARGWHSYVEGGVSAFFGASCDVDLAGGPGFLGGITLACDEWVPESSSSAAPITGVSAGVRPVLGFGVTRRRIGGTLRLEPMGTMAETTTGDISSTTMTLNVEWTFGRRK